MKQRVAQVPGVADLDSSYEQGKPEIRVHINRDKAADLNVSVASIATALRTLVGGDDQVSSFRDGDDRYDVQLRLSKEFRDTPGALERLYVPSGSLGNVSVASVASLEHGRRPHADRALQPAAADPDQRQPGNGQSLSVVIPIVNQALADLHMPPEYRTGLFGGSKEFGRAAAGFVLAFVLSMVFMYMVLAAQFESFIDPIVILISLPLSVPFALLSLLLAHQNFSIIYNSLGVLILFGIVKKNSILQIDHIKSLQAQGMERGQAILRGCEDRLRPILMTTAALVAGMIPLALGTGAGASSRRTVAIVVIGGQSLCLLLTLLVTPVAYSLAEDFVHAAFWRKLAKLLRGMSPRRVAGAAGALLLVLSVAGPLSPRRRRAWVSARSSASSRSKTLSRRRCPPTWTSRSTGRIRRRRWRPCAARMAFSIRLSAGCPTCNRGIRRRDRSWWARAECWPSMNIPRISISTRSCHSTARHSA